MSGDDEGDTSYDNRVSQTRYEAYQVLQKSTYITQSTFGRYVVQIGSRYGQKFDPMKPSYSTVRV